MKAFQGRVEGCEFVGTDDEDGREPGTYVIIRLDAPRAPIISGSVVVKYIPE